MENFQVPTSTVIPNAADIRTVGNESLDVDDILELSSKKAIVYVIVTTVTVLGVFGNLASFLVLWRSPLSRFSYTVYLRALAVYDTINLLEALILRTDRIVWDLQGYSFLAEFHGDGTCKIGEFLRHTNMLMSSWLVAAFSIDRYIAVGCPFLKFRICTPRTAKMVTITLVFCTSVSQMFRLVFVQFNPQTSRLYKFVCLPGQSSQDLYFLINFFLFSFALRFLVPFVTLTVCNSLVICHIKHRNIRHFKAGAQIPAFRLMTPSKSRNNQARLAQTALFLVCAYFVCTMLPSSLIEIIWYSAKVQHNYELFLHLLPFEGPFEILRLTNYAVNFLLYTISFRSFREELRSYALVITARFSSVRTDKSTT